LKWERSQTITGSDFLLKGSFAYYKFKVSPNCYKPERIQCYKAAVAGDFTMLENEVEPVLKALIENGIEVGTTHSTGA